MFATISIMLFILAFASFILVRRSKQASDKIKSDYYKRRMNTHLKLVKHFKPKSSEDAITDFMAKRNSQFDDLNDIVAQANQVVREIEEKEQQSFKIK